MEKDKKYSYKAVLLIQGTVSEPISITDLIKEITSAKSKSPEQLKAIKKLKDYDFSTIGNLYHTSGGRVVLDRGYGEYFNEKDKVIANLSTLLEGIPYEEFKKKV